MSENKHASDEDYRTESSDHVLPTSILKLLVKVYLRIGTQTRRLRLHKDSTMMQQLLSVLST